VPRRVMQLELLLEPPPLRPADGSLRRTVLSGGPLWYGLVRSSRRTLAIVVDRSKVDVRAPRWTPVAEIERFLREKERWIRRRIEDARREPSPFLWREGERLPVLGEQLRLSLSAAAAGIRRSERSLEVGLAAPCGPAQLRTAVLAWLRSEARRVFVERIAHFAPRLGVASPDMKLSNARTQWGSCNARGRVLLNWRLVHLPPSLIDYVVAHELSHLKELNHSRRFWSLVASVYPGYTGARRELERLGRQLPEL
jgi:predicted metal-dependent hydrolase